MSKQIDLLCAAAEKEIPHLRGKRNTRWAADLMERLVAAVRGAEVPADDPETPRQGHSAEVAVPEAIPAQKTRRKRKEASDGEA